MKKLAKLLSVIIASMLMFSLAFSTVGCGEEDDPTVVTWAIWNSGWGIDVQTELAQTWNDKYAAQHGFTVEIEQSASQTALAQEFGNSVSTYDIFSVPFHGTRGWEHCYNLKDLIQETVNGESTKIIDKIPAAVMDKVTFDNGDVLWMPGQSSQFSGITYNHYLFEQVNVAQILGREKTGNTYTEYDHIPRTTAELIKLTNNPKFNNAEHRAWIHFADGWNGYYPYVMELWAAHHNGVEKHNELHYLEKDPDIGENGAYARFKEKDGRYYMFLEMSKLLNQNKVQTASNSANFTTQQTAFLDGQAMMMVNGNWLGAEMQKNDGIFDGSKFRMMRTPIMSTIINRLPTINDDATLSTVISLIDNGKTYAEAAQVVNGLSEADYNEVKIARGMKLCGSRESGNYIANYSIALENAKTFFKFIYSDEAGVIFRAHKKLDPMMTFDDKSLYESFDYNSLSAWDKSVRQCWDDEMTYSVSLSVAHSRLYDSTDTHGNVDIIKRLTSTNASDRKSIEALWTEFQTYIDNNWTNWMAD